MKTYAQTGGRPIGSLSDAWAWASGSAKALRGKTASTLSNLLEMLLEKALESGGDDE
jgi:hypothetical protein